MSERKNSKNKRSASVERSAKGTVEVKEREPDTNVNAAEPATPEEPSKSSATPEATVDGGLAPEMESQTALNGEHEPEGAAEPDAQAEPSASTEVGAAAAAASATPTAQEAAPADATDERETAAAEAPAAQAEEDVTVELTSVSDPPEPGPANPSPDGTRLAFLQANDSGQMQLWFYSLDGSGAWTIDLPFVPVLDEAGPQWSPDGAQLAMAGKWPGAIESAIWIVPVEGGACRVLADHPGSDHSPRWSPDGYWVAFISERDGRGGLVVIDSEGEAPAVALTHGYPGQNEREPVWAEDGSRIAFLRRAFDGENVGDHIWTVSLMTGEAKQITKKLANRHSLRWCPGKAQLACISDEGEWLNVAVVNPDNSAGWNLASEVGDKGDPHYSPDGSRILYTRALKGEVRLCERATSGAAADPIDQGMGVVSSPRWLPEKRVVYRFAPATGAPSFVVQDTAKQEEQEVERITLPAPSEWSPEATFVEPVHVEYETTSGSKLGGLFYKQSTATGPLPGVVVLGPDPSERVTAHFQPVEQALASAGFAVYTPTLPGTPGYGRKLFNALRDATAPEAEVSDLADIVATVRSLDAVDGKRVAVVGWGYGGALALLLAGARPGSVDAVVAIDPVADWDLEYDQGSENWRAWQARQLGLPAANRGRYAVRTPDTFVGVIGAPLLLIDTPEAPASRAEQLAQIIATLQEAGVPYEHEHADQETAWRTGRRAARFIRGQFGPNTPAAAPEPEPAPEPPGEGMRTDAI